MTHRADACLSDMDMCRYDYTNNFRVAADWSKKDRTLARIKTPLQQRAGTWSAFSPHLIQQFTPISQQGQIGSCVANAWCDMMEILDGLDGNDKVEQLSRLFLYWTSRYYTGDTDRDGGTYPRSAGHQLNKIGIVEERYFPYEGTADIVFKSPELDLYTMASNNRLSGFYRPESLEPDGLLAELELAIRANHPYTFGAPVTKSFTTYGGGGHIWGPPRDSDELAGWHAMICVGVGYDGTTRWWLLRNSWGLDFGDAGHVKVNDAYVLAFRDFWIGTKMPEFV